MFWLVFILNSSCGQAYRVELLNQWKFANALTAYGWLVLFWWNKTAPPKELSDLTLTTKSYPYLRFSLSSLAASTPVICLFPTFLFICISVIQSSWSFPVFLYGWHCLWQLMLSRLRNGVLSRYIKSWQTDLPGLMDQQPQNVILKGRHIAEEHGKE